MVWSRSVTGRPIALNLPVCKIIFSFWKRQHFRNYRKGKENATFQGIANIIKRLSRALCDEIDFQFKFTLLLKFILGNKYDWDETAILPSFRNTAKTLQLLWFSVFTFFPERKRIHTKPLNARWQRWFTLNISMDAFCYLKKRRRHTQLSLPGVLSNFRFLVKNLLHEFQNSAFTTRGGKGQKLNSFKKLRCHLSSFQLRHGVSRQLRARVKLKLS